MGTPGAIEYIDKLERLPVYVGKNKCIDQLRQQKLLERRKEEFKTVFDKEIQLKIYALQQFDENALSNEDIEIILNNAINSLPEKCREVFILSRMEGLKNREIAEKAEYIYKNSRESNDDRDPETES